MTEITEHTDLRDKGHADPKVDALPAAIEQFVLQWGDLGNHWGVNRSIAQIHALLYIQEQPLTADEIVTHLNIARSNVSNSLRELLGWQLISRVPIRGDRRDHYTAEKDMWTMLMRIAAGRKAREIDPAKAALERCVADAKADKTISKKALTRLNEMLIFMTALDSWYEQMLTLSKGQLTALVKLGSKVVSILGRRKT